MNRIYSDKINSICINKKINANRFIYQIKTSWLLYKLNLIKFYSFCTSCLRESFKYYIFLKYFDFSSTLLKRFHNCAHSEKFAQCSIRMSKFFIASNNFNYFQLEAQFCLCGFFILFHLFFTTVVCVYVLQKSIFISVCPFKVIFNGWILLVLEYKFNGYSDLFIVQINYLWLKESNFRLIVMHTDCNSNLIVVNSRPFIFISNKCKRKSQQILISNEANDKLFAFRSFIHG